MIILPSVRQRIASVPLLFRASAVLGAESLTALSYGRTLTAVFTRTDDVPTYGVLDQRGRRGWAAENRPRFVHVQDGSRWVPVLIIEAASENLMHVSQEFTAGPWSYTNVTANAPHIGPDGRQAAARLTATATAASVAAQTRVVAATRAAFSVDVKRGSSATTPNNFVLRNNTSGTDLVGISFDYALGTFAYTSGAAGAAVMRLATSDWYRIMLSATTGITSGDSMRGYVGFAGGVHTAGDNLFAANAQLEARGWPSSPIRVVATTPQSRGAESCYFPVNLTLKPCTIYVRFKELGTGVNVGGNAGICGLGSGDNASIFILTGGAGSYYAIHRQASDIATGGALPVVAFGDMVELRLQILEGGALRLSQSLNGGPEVIAPDSAAQTFFNTTFVQRFYLGSRGPLPDVTGIHSALISEGYPSLTECRDLCEVG